MAELPPGFSSRPADPDRDVDQILDLCREAAIAEYGSPDIDERIIRGAFRLPGLDPDRDTLLVLDDADRAAGTATYYDGDTQHIAPYFFFRVRPEVADGTVPDVILAWGADRATMNAHLAPDGARVALYADTAAVNADIVAALERNGWRRDRVDWTMEIDLAAAAPLPQPQWPEGISVRSADTANLERDARLLHDTEKESFSDHYGYTPVPFEEWWHFRTEFNQAEPDLWLLAMDGAEVAGMCLVASQRAGQPDLGWISSLGVRRPWRRRGLALALLLHGFRLLAGRGKTRAGLGVDSQSLTGATRLYEKAGMHVVRESYEYERVVREGEDLRTTELVEGAAT
jgi:ribosomal protein S18 acetylase RimI-like enzyme